MTPNQTLQRSGFDKVLGRGRGNAVLEQVLRARVRSLNGAVRRHSSCVVASATIVSLYAHRTRYYP
jgi:hypothetical protein